MSDMKQNWSIESLEGRNLACIWTMDYGHEIKKSIV
jgi:hypothetical protein